MCIEQAFWLSLIVTDYNEYRVMNHLHQFSYKELMQMFLNMKYIILKTLKENLLL